MWDEKIEELEARREKRTMVADRQELTNSMKKAS